MGVCRGHPGPRRRGAGIIVVAGLRHRSAVVVGTAIGDAQGVGTIQNDDPLPAISIDDVPHGIAFLLNRNRLNVAVSRAKYLAVIVRSAQLTAYLPSTPDRLLELGAFLALCPSDPADVTDMSLHDTNQKPRGASVP